MRIRSTRGTARQQAARIRSVRALPRLLLIAPACFVAAACLASPPPERASAPAPAATAGPSPRTPLDLESAVHLLARATYGVRARDVEELLRIGLEGWLERQLHPETLEDALLAERLRFEGPPTIEIRSPLPGAGAGAGAAAGAAPAGPVPRNAHFDAAVAQGTIYDLERARAAYMASQRRRIGYWATAKLERAVHSERQLEEVMTDFWFNHFNVFWQKHASVSVVLDDYEENAIRRHVFGRFEDMLRASAQHPAMLVYLDNFLSTAPLPPPALPPPGAASAVPWFGGLNENYARELLELHTLGVDGGYTQRDVIEAARAFTGWTVPTGRPGAGGGPPGPSSGEDGLVFEFRPDWHDTGEKVVLGRRLPAGRGLEDGLEVIAMLSRHPATARHIATKLARHFVADEPPPALVEELAAVFVATDGDLREVTRALFTSERFYDPAHRGAKVKRPFEFLTSALRATGADLQPQRESSALVGQLRDFRHLPYSERAPTGYPTTAEEWVSAGAMLSRVNFALELVQGRVEGVAVDPWTALGEPAPAADAAGAADPTEPAPLRDLTSRLVQRMLPAAPASRVGPRVLEDLARQPEADLHTLLARAVALVLGSPEFQRH